MNARRVAIVAVLVLAVLVVAGCNFTALLSPTSVPWMFEIDLAAWMSVV